MALFNSEMTPEKAIEALGSDKEAKVEKGIEFLTAGGAELLPFMVKRFGEIVPQATRSKKHQLAAERLYDLLCGAELPVELCASFLESLLNAPENLSFNLDELPVDVVINGYSFLEETIR
ncbi:hypothetical protein LJC08_05245, partial [Methanimicrococcus sp. OttesenSCG-928-J09]|nr:hypothetical protein [Methanimicrococcus sp. OttesenSCG-928-J09]